MMAEDAGKNSGRKWRGEIGGLALANGGATRITGMMVNVAMV